MTFVTAWWVTAWITSWPSKWQFVAGFLLFNQKIVRSWLLEGVKLLAFHAPLLAWKYILKCAVGRQMVAMHISFHTTLTHQQTSLLEKPQFMTTHSCMLLQYGSIYCCEVWIINNFMNFILVEIHSVINLVLTESCYYISQNLMTAYCFSTAGRVDQWRKYCNVPFPLTVSYLLTLQNPAITVCNIQYNSQ